MSVSKPPLHPVTLALVVKAFFRSFVALFTGGLALLGLTNATHHAQPGLPGPLSLLSLSLRRALCHAGQFGPDAQKSSLRPLAL